MKTSKYIEGYRLVSSEEKRFFGLCCLDHLELTDLVL